jgi:hypothetical protein
MDPLLVSLKRLLTGIEMCNVPAFGPMLENEMSLPRVKERFSALSHADDLKIGIVKIDEIMIVVEQCRELVQSSGVRLHRSADSGKCKLLPVGSWVNNVSQEDIPFDFICLTDTIICVGVRLCSNYFLSRTKNNDLVTEKINILTNIWRSGRHMGLVDRAHALNSKILAKIWHQASSLPIRNQDTDNITRIVKGWLLADCYNKKISDIIVYNSPEKGGLGLFHVKSRCESFFIRNFLQTAGNRKYKGSVRHKILLQERIHGRPPDQFSIESSPWYNRQFWIMISQLQEKWDRPITEVSIREIYKLRLDSNVLQDNEGNEYSIPIELSVPHINWVLTWHRLHAI